DHLFDVGRTGAVAGQADTYGRTPREPHETDPGPATGDHARRDGRVPVGAGLRTRGVGCRVHHAHHRQWRVVDTQPAVLGEPVGEQFAEPYVPLDLLGVGAFAGDRKGQ